MLGQASGSGSANGQIPLYSDASFPPGWPLLSDPSGTDGFGGDVKGDAEWGKEDDTELGALRWVSNLTSWACLSEREN